MFEELLFQKQTSRFYYSYTLAHAWSPFHRSKRDETMSGTLEKYCYKFRESIARETTLFRVQIYGK